MSFTVINLALTGAPELPTILTLPRFNFSSFSPVFAVAISDTDPLLPYITLLPSSATFFFSKIEATAASLGSLMDVAGLLAVF